MRAIGKDRPCSGGKWQIGERQVLRGQEGHWILQALGRRKTALNRTDEWETGASKEV
jgi:hypothetical protein